MDNTNVEKHIKELLSEIGENTEREGLLETPKRVARMYKELFRGYNEAEKPKITTFFNGADGITTDQLITDTGDFHSHCEHHMVPFFGNYYFAYIPSAKGKILGLSKVARIVDFYSAKLQIQERLVKNIVDALWDALCEDGAEPPIAMGVVMKGEHLCKTMRGAKKKGKMTTSELRGELLINDSLRQEFLSLMSL